MKQFINRVKNSEIDIIGRIAVFVLAVAAIVFFNSKISSIYIPTCPYAIKLFISAILFCICLVGLAIAIVLLCLLLNCIIWVFTGDFWNSDISDSITESAKNFVSFIVLFIFGNWNRISKKDKNEKSK